MDSHQLCIAGQFAFSVGQRFHARRAGTKASISLVSEYVPDVLLIGWLYRQLNGMKIRHCGGKNKLLGMKHGAWNGDRLLLIERETGSEDRLLEKTG